MIAVIMAAGMGTRFGSLTESRPKAFIEVSGRPMITRSVENLLSNGIDKIVIGTGYRHEMFDSLKSSYPGIETCYNPVYDRTNSMYTLYNTRQLIGDEDFILLESDLIYEPAAIRYLLESDRPDVMLVSPLTKFQDQYYVEYDRDMYLVGCSTDKTALTPMGELVGIHKLSNRFYWAMCTDYGTKADREPKLGYEFEILHMARTQIRMSVLKPDSIKWYEIDDERDLQYAEKNVAAYC